MNFPDKYKALKVNIFSKGECKLVPIRYQDRLDIMKWRNEQMYHLRQEVKLSEENQENYFQNIVFELFNKEQPNQLLFSYLENDICIGYGGLVHINWIDKNAEISFIMKTNLEKIYFRFHWENFLSLIEKVAFRELNFHKLNTYAFDLRPYLYNILEDNGYFKEAELKEQCFYDNNYINVIIHSKINLNGCKT